MWQSIASVVAGYVVMAAIVIVGTILAASTMIPGGIAAAKNLETLPPSNYLRANLALSFVAAVAAGWITATTAPSRPSVHVLTLTVLLIAMSLFSARSPAKNQPSWYPRAMMTIGAAGVLIGGFFQIWSSAI